MLRTFHVKRTTVIAIFLLSSLQQVWMPSVSFSSQTPGHLFFASKMLTGPVQKFLVDDPESVRSYLQGSIGPDVLWLVSLASSPSLRTSLETQYQIRLPNEWSRLPAPLPDIHWQRAVETTLNLLSSAQTPKEEAYALGWTTHFIVDAHVHKLIAERVGYPTDPLDLKDPSLRAHDRLEALESRHVFSRYAAVMRLTHFDEDDPFESPGDLLLRALSVTFPDHVAVQTSNYNVIKSMLHRAEFLARASSHWHYYQATHSRERVERDKKLMQRFRPEQGRMVQFLTDLPSKEEYETQHKASDFIAAWEKTKDKVLADANEILPLCVLYLWRQQKLSAPGAGAGNEDDYNKNLLRQIETHLRRLSPTGDIR